MDIQSLLTNTAISVFNQVIGTAIDEEIPFVAQEDTRITQAAKLIIELQADGKLTTEDAVAILRILKQYR